MGELAQRVREHYPDDYKDWSDEEIEVAMMQKHPGVTKYMETSSPTSRIAYGKIGAQKAQNAPEPPPLTNADVISGMAPTGAPVVDAPLRGLARGVDYVRNSPVGTAVGAAHQAIEVPYQGLGMLADMIMTGGKNIKVDAGQGGITGAFTGGAGLEKQLPQQLIEGVKKEALGTAGFTTGAPGSVLPGDEPNIRAAFAKENPVTAGVEGVANKAAQLGIQMGTDPAMMALGPMARAGGAPLEGMIGPQALTTADKAARAASAGLGASFAGPMIAGAGEQAGEAASAAEQGDIATAIEKAGGAAIDAAFAAHVGKGIRKSVSDFGESAKQKVSDFQERRKAAAQSKPAAGASDSGEEKQPGFISKTLAKKYEYGGKVAGTIVGAATMPTHPFVGAGLGKEILGKAGREMDVRAAEKKAAAKGRTDNKPDGAVGAVDPNMSTTGTKPAAAEAPLAKFVKPEEAQAPKASSTGTTPYYVEPNLKLNVPEGAKAGVEEAVASDQKQPKIEGERKHREFEFNQEVAPKVEGDETGSEEAVKPQEAKHEFNTQSVGQEADRTGGRKSVEEGAKVEKKRTESPKNAMEALFATQKEEVGGASPIEVPRKEGGPVEEQMGKQQKLGEQAKAKQARREAIPGYTEAKAAREASPEFQQRVEHPDLVKQFENPKQRRAIVHNQMEAEAKTRGQENPESAKAARGEAFTALDNLQKMSKGKTEQPSLEDQLKASLKTKNATPAKVSEQAPEHVGPQLTAKEHAAERKALQPVEEAPSAPAEARKTASAATEPSKAATVAPEATAPLMAKAKVSTTQTVEPGKTYKVGDQLPNGKYVQEVDENGRVAVIGKHKPGQPLQKTMAEGLAEAQEATPPVHPTQESFRSPQAVREMGRMMRTAREGEHQGMLFPREEQPLEKKISGGISRPDQFNSIEDWWNHHKELGFSDTELRDALKENAPLEKRIPKDQEPVDTVAVRQGKTAERNSESVKNVQKQLQNADISSLPEDEQVKRMADQGEKEVLYQRNQIRSGEKWYKHDISAMESALAKEEPSLKNPDNMSIFKLIAATTSFGNRPNPNIEVALTIYRELKNEGRLATRQDSGKHWPGSPVFEKSAPKIDALVAAKGWKGSVEWMMAKHPVSEIREWNKNVSGKASEMKFGSEALGPKGSPFFQNLMGNHSQTTADMWYSRTFNRWRGTEMKDAPRNDSELKMMRVVNDEIARRTGIDPADTQAMLWFHEKALYGRMGAKEDFGSYAVASRRAAESLRAGKAEVSAKSPVKPQQQTVAMEVKFGTGSPFSKQYDWSSLSQDQARQITNEHGRFLIDHVEAETGARIEQATPSTGVYQGSANPNWIVKIKGTPEQLNAASHLFGLGAQQESVIASRPSANGDPGLVVTGGKGWDKPGFLEKVWDGYSKRMMFGADGGASLSYEGDNPSIQIYGDTLDKEALKQAVLAADPKANVKIVNKKFETQSYGNDWKESPDGEAYRAGLRKLGYSENGINEFVSNSGKSLDRAWNNAKGYRNEAGNEGTGREGGAQAVDRGEEHVVPQADRGRNLEGLPEKVKVDGQDKTYGAFKPAQDAAAKYMKDNKLKYDPPRTYARVSRERAARIADEFEKMKHDPNDPGVKKAYRAMIDETAKQFQAMLDTGIKVEFINGPDPYENPRKAIEDVVKNNHLWVFPTDTGFGSDEGFKATGNPLLEPTKFKISGKTALANDIFRAVHDYFGHIKEGVGFRADGEENAWRSHSAMYSPEARKAMTTETRGQNSWLNFGPHGEANRTAKTADTVFADQKTGLLPDWVVNEGAKDSDILKRNMGEALDSLDQLRQRIDASTKEAFAQFKGEAAQVKKIKTGEESRAEARKDPVGYVIDNTVNYLFDNMQRVAEKTGVGGYFGKRTPALEAYQGKYVNREDGFEDAAGGRMPVWRGKPTDFGQLYVDRHSNLYGAAVKLANRVNGGSAKVLEVVNGAAKGDKNLEILKNEYEKELQETIAHEMLHSFRDTEDATQAMQDAMNKSANQLLDTPTESGKTLRQELAQYWDAKSFQDKLRQSVQQQAKRSIENYNSHQRSESDALRREGPKPLQASLGGMLKHASESKNTVRQPAKGVIYQKSKFTQPRLAPKVEGPLAGMIKR